MDAVLTDPAIFSLIVGLGLLGIDIFIVGLSPLMFVAVAALVTSGLLYATGWRPTLVATAALASTLSLLIAGLGWRPLRAFQGEGVEEDLSSDLIGHELLTTHEVTRASGVVRWSGVEWQARLAENAAIDKAGVGARMRIVKVENLALVLEPCAPAQQRSEPIARTPS